MFKVGSLVFLLAETHTHPGAGEGVGYIDQAIQRDRATGLPIIQASSLKGALRRHLNAEEKPDSGPHAGEEDGSPEMEGDEGTGGGDSPGFASLPDILFGKEGYAGAASPVDARLLLLPVASLKGIFAWVTCPYALQLLHRDALLCGEASAVDRFPGFRGGEVGEDEALVSSVDSEPVIKAEAAQREHGDVSKRSGEAASQSWIVLDGLTFRVRQDERLARLARWLSEQAFPRPESQPDYLAERLCAEDGEPTRSSIVVVSDGAFRDFARFAMEVIERNTIDDASGTSEFVWTEEHLPAQSFLYSPLFFCDPHLRNGVPADHKTADDLRRRFGERLKKRSIFQIGGHETLGRGIMRARLWPSFNGAATGSRESTTRGEPSNIELEPGPAPKPAASKPSDPGSSSRYEARAQRAAQFAYENVGTVVDAKGAVAKEYRSLVRGAPALLRRAGLPGMVAFLLSKAEGLTSNDAPSQSNGRVSAAWHLYTHLEEWICDEGVGVGAIWAVPDHTGREHVRLLDAIRQQPSYWVRLATDCAEEALLWHKRAAEAFIPASDT